MNQRIISVLSSRKSRHRFLFAAALALSICATNLYRITISTFSDEWDNDDGGADSIIRDSHHPSTSSYEPYVNRWQRRFSSKGGVLFFKHMRKAGGTLLHNYLHAFLEYHGHGTFQQFLQSTNQKEVMRHFPFLDSGQKQFAQSYFNTTNDTSKHHMPNKVFFVEQEFSTMDWQCRDIDPRWNDSLSIAILRHPIERHLSEFFYSGPPATSEFDGIKFGRRGNNRRLQINRTKLYTNITYTSMLSEFLQENLQLWTKKIDKIPFYFKWYFRPRYIDNYQVRALSGCASGDCLMTKNVTHAQRGTIYRSHPSIANDATKPIDSVCTMHPFYKPHLRDLCSSKTDPNVCLDCDGPCFYPAVAWGTLTQEDLSRAIHALEGFDLVFITETMGDKDQLSLLADAMGAPRNISIATELGNVNVMKQSSREKMHYYRDLITKLTHPELIKSLCEENKLEIELYDHAVRLNKIMTERWKREVKWNDAQDDQ